MTKRTFGFVFILVAAGSAAVVSAVQQGEGVRFSDVTAKARVGFRHENGASPEKHLPETMSGGVVLFDFDNDGWPDIFFVNGGSFMDTGKAAGAQHRLYRNNKDGTFADVSATSGIGVSGFGMGACSADYDNDRFPDLYITGADFSRLYRNTGKGSFADVTSNAGVASTLWNASCAFGDIDSDGDVDLYVTRYVDYTPERNKYCPLWTARAYCHPNEYNGVPDLLFRNNGDGTFADISRESGIRQRPSGGNGLGVVLGDYDNDRLADIYVANDSTPNFLFHNKGGGRFEEVGFLAGVAVGHDGKPQAGMGTDMGDFDGDGLTDIFVTNLIMETHTLYRNLGKGLFADVTFTSGVAEMTLPYVGFGTAFVDYDNDMDLDLAIANGHVIDNVHLGRDDTTYEQLNLLLQNDSGKFRSAGPASGEGFAIKKSSRALVVGDLDNDGDMDIVIANVRQTPDILRNDGGNRSNALLVRTIGTRSNRDGIGARLKLSVGGKVLARDVKAGSGYLGQNDLRVHFGMGRKSVAERLEILWPSGTVDTLETIDANQILTVREGEGVIDRQSFKR